MNDITVYTARLIHTMDEGSPVASAVAISEGRIVSVGTLESMKPWLDKFPHSIDDRFADKIIFPGFIDPHCHLRMSGVMTGLTYIGPIEQQTPNGMAKGIKTRSEIIDRLKQAIDERENPDDPVIAWGMDPLIHGEFMHRDELDAISKDVPIWVMTYAPHVISVNTPMLQRTGVDENTTVYGIERYEDGRLNGQFIERGATPIAIKPVQSFLADPKRSYESLWRQGGIAQSVGITMTSDMTFGGVDFDWEWETHQKVVLDPDYPLRIWLVPVADKVQANHGENSVKFLQEMQKKNTDKLGFHGIKFINDGSYPAMTLRLKSPGYIDGRKGHRGAIAWEELEATMLPYWKAGLQIHSHANGDETVDMTLDLLQRLQLAHPRFDHRFTIEHYCISSPDQAMRLKALGGIASVNNMFVHYRALMQSEVGFGPDKSAATARLGSLERAGVTFALHSDFSLVLTPISPLTAVWIGVNRIASDGKTVLAPGERIGVHRAMRAITIDAAYILGRESKFGSIEAGKFADFTILEEDPYDVAPEKIKDVRVWGTILGGQVHKAGSVSQK